MNALLLSFGLIFAAELGDKSQLMAMTLAARYRGEPGFCTRAGDVVVHFPRAGFFVMPT